MSLLGEKGEVAAPEVSIVLLEKGSARKQVLATYINAYLGNQYLFNLTLNIGFFHCFSLLPDSCLSRLLHEWAY